MVQGGVDMKEKREIDVHIGRQIKKVREAAGFTQDKFAEMIGMGTKNISAIERGQAGISVSALKRICKTLCISSDTLIMDESSNMDIERLDFLVERLKHLSVRQLDLAFDINNKLFEAFALQGNENKS
jgi:transcriptional regulator with XRE-family HTH domain